MRRTAYPVAAASLLGLIAGPGPAHGQSSAERRIQSLETVIEQQQRQLDLLRRGLEELRQSTRATSEAAASAQQTAEEARKAAAEKPLIESGSPKIRLALTGQIKRALNLADDGHSTKAYFVDNDVSNSRLRLEDTGELADGGTLGTVIELGISPNNSYDVGQDNAALWSKPT